ncbi:MAG: hypothetical protein DLM69_00385 [Candidatus Chloroheliales bacterium]|nr:MAG: hypothetical protein DLM69_00385 [Chloroflexota bacterium]
MFGLLIGSSLYIGVVDRGCIRLCTWVSLACNAGAYISVGTRIVPHFSYILVTDIGIAGSILLGVFAASTTLFLLLGVAVSEIVHSLQPPLCGDHKP